jgi:hypothetical protein
MSLALMLIMVEMKMKTLMMMVNCTDDCGCSGYYFLDGTPNPIAKMDVR